MKNLIIITLTIFFLSCSNDYKKEAITEKKTITETKKKIPPVNYYHFEHKLPDSDLAYIIDITDIDLNLKKDFFEITKEKYSQPESLDGVNFSIGFKMTNPYSKKMRIPFPHYYYITSPKFDGLKGFIYSKSCQCYIDNTTDIETKKGEPLRSISKYIDGNFFLDFEGNETKEFTIKFTEPFPKFNDLKSITFVGFNKHLKKHVDFYKLSKEEQKEWLADKSTEYALKINLESKKIIELSEFKR